MRVLHVIDSMNPTHGGPSACVASLAAAQADLGHEVAIVVPQNADYAEYAPTLTDSLPALNRVDVRPVETISRKAALRNESAARLDDSIGSADIVHVHGLWDAVGWKAARKCLKRGVPYVVCPHGMLNRWSIRHKALRKRTLLVLTVNSILRKASFVHALNGHEAREISRVCPGTQVQVFGNGVFADEIPAGVSADGFRHIHPELGSDPYLLTLGRLHHVKGLDVLMDAFARVARDVAHLRLVLAGPDDGEGSALAVQASRLGVSRRVHFVGPIYGDQKWSALNGALCLVQPSRQEGFSMSIAEAMGAATPVLVSEGCHFPEIAARDAGLVVPLTVPDLAQGIRRYCADPDRTLQIGLRGQQMILGDYTWPSIAGRMSEAYTHTVYAEGEETWTPT